MPEGRKSYTKTKPIQDEEFADCLVWWKNREENQSAWKYNFREAYNQAIKEATPHWEAAKKAEKTAYQCAKNARELAERINSVGTFDELPLLQITTDKNQIYELKDNLIAFQEEEKKQREIVKYEQAKGDTIYWSIYNFDRKNPNIQQDFEHLPPEQLIVGILEKDRRVAEIMVEIQQMLVGASE